MRDRRQIAGYVDPAEFERIQRIAKRRSVTVASMVSRATMWLVRYLEAEELNSLGPLLDVGVSTPPRDAAADLVAALDDRERLVEEPARWKFQRDEQRARRLSMAAPITAERRARKQQSNTDET
jgi:hypothetical protein